MANPRTSKSDPLSVARVDVPAAGALGMTFAPGKVQPAASTGAWERDLDADLTRLRDGTTSRDLWRDGVRSRVRGSLLAGAVGDALGAPLEFLTLAKIRAEYGDADRAEMRPSYGRLGAITDDTQMTLFTAEGLLRARGARASACRGERETSDVVVAVKHAYYRWFWTQGEQVPKAMTPHATGWLFADKRLYQRRAPGSTCLSALSAHIQADLGGRPLPEPINDSKGCGGVMRAAPAGLLADDPWTLGARLAELTHGHRAGYDTAGLFAEMISETLHGRPLGDAAAAVWARRRDACHPDTQRAMAAAFHLLRSGAAPTPALVESLGQGWVAEEALAISLYCALACPDLESALSLAVTHSGDSDSTGSLTGNLLGAALGEGAIPARWLDALEARDLIEKVADHLATAASEEEVDRERDPSSPSSQ